VSAEHAAAGVAEKLELVDAGAAWNEAGERLRALDPVTYGRLLVLAEALVANEEREIEAVDVFGARLQQVAGAEGLS
jgi:hypothetical protein